MRIKITLSLMCLGSFLCHSQSDWRTMLGNQDINFSIIQQNFYAEFGDQIGPKGSGWKQFKRWEYYQEQRLDENGDYPDPGQNLIELKKYNDEHPEAKTYTLGSGNWQILGPINKPTNGTGVPNGNGRLTCITFHPTNANIIYAGSPAGGFWKSLDNGVTWVEYSIGLTRLGVSSIVIHPTTPSTIYIGTGDRDGGDSPGYGVWKSIDGGVTWAASNTGMGNRTVYEVLMDLSNSNILVAITNGSRFYRSTDGGLNWTYTAALSSNSKDIAFHPTNSNIIYASGTKLDRSTDNGQTFTEITSGVPAGSQRIALAVSANQPNYVYLLAGGGSGLIGAYRSTDSGLNFTTRSTTPNILGYSATGADASSQAWYDLVLAADPMNANVLFAAGINIWKSIDGGTNWTISGHWTGSGGVSAVHADHHALDFSPLNGALYNGNDGGFYTTTDGGTVWNEFSNGLYISQMYKIGVSQTVENTVITGFQDNGTAIYYNGNWSTEIGGDGMECIIDPTDETYMYGASYYGDMRRSTNGGANFSQIADNGTNGINESGAWVTPYTLDPNNVARMFIGYDNVWRSDDVKSPAANAVVWTRISNFGGSSNMTDLAVAPSNSNVIYVSRSTAAGRFYKSTNALGGAPTWTDLNASLPVASTPKDIEIDPTDPDHLFIAINNDIYESTNGGTSWTNYSGTLPNVSLNTIVIDKDGANLPIYVGMDVGVYYRDNTMADWVLYATGLPNIEISELEIYSNVADCKSKLMAGSYGQGLWVSDLKDPGNVLPIACFEVSSTDPCMGQTVLLTSNSAYTPVGWTWSISPVTHSYVNATTANSENPEVQFSTVGLYTIQLTATNVNGNDVELKTNYVTVSSSTNASTFPEDFESFALCGTASDCETTLCPIIGKWNNLTNGTDDDIDWRVDEGGTPSAGTGPTVDFNPGTAVGNYAYLEASACAAKTAILESGCIFLDQNYEFSVGYHMLGGAMGSLHVDLFDGSTWTYDFIPSISGDQGASWLVTTPVDLTAYTGTSIIMRLRGITGGGFASDLSIDDITFTPIISLPIEFLSFEAKALNNTVQLKWETASELNADYYEVQRSDDAINWTTILEENAAGTSNSVLNYEAWDMHPLRQISYYRLKAIDFDGEFKYSDIRQVSFVDMSITVHPNPANGYVVLDRNGIAKDELRLSNVLGQRVPLNISSVAENSLTIDISELQEGLYFVHLKDLNGRETIAKFIVKH
ncbi:MAG: PKD repeat protein [Flavobacteriaceae bacterium]|jgi:PKD repeat protein